MSDRSPVFYLKVIGLPVLAALLFYFFYTTGEWNDIWVVMSVSFFFGLPYLTGVVAIYASPPARIRDLSYRILFPWAPIGVFFVITLALALEGWVCWIMILPIFLVLGTLGGLTAGYLRMRASKNLNRLQLSLAVVLPLIASPVEQAIGPDLAMFKAYTFIDITAPADRIWGNVTRVREIGPDEDTGTLTKWMGIPRPLRAELNYEGLGAERLAIFSGGLVFTEVVTQYEKERHMTFSITPNTGEIPATTFDEHILIGGDYFDVLSGTYELERLPDGSYRLHLWSVFETNTTFNVYAGLWARWIMQDIQNNILRVIKARSETTELTHL